MRKDDFKHLETQKPEYWRGICAAYDDYETGDIYDLSLAREMFIIDRPDSDFQRGYLRAVIAMDSGQ